MNYITEKLDGSDINNDSINYYYSLRNGTYHYQYIIHKGNPITSNSYSSIKDSSSDFIDSKIIIYDL